MEVGWGSLSGRTTPGDSRQPPDAQLQSSIQPRAYLSFHMIFTQKYVGEVDNARRDVRVSCALRAECGCTLHQSETGRGHHKYCAVLT